MKNEGEGKTNQREKNIIPASCCHHPANMHSVLDLPRIASAAKVILTYFNTSSTLTLQKKTVYSTRYFIMEAGGEFISRHAGNGSSAWNKCIYTAGPV